MARALGPLLALVLLPPRAARADPSQNLVVDGSFETPGKPAAGWPCSSLFTRVTDVVHAPSSAALRYSNPDPTIYNTCCQHVPLLPGRRYNASAWVKSENITGKDSGASLYLEYHNGTGAAGYLGGVYPAGVKGKTDWTQIWTNVDVPTDATSVTLGVYVRQGMSGTAWYDGVQVGQLGSWADMRTVLLSPVYRGRIVAGGCAAVRLRASLDYAMYDHTAASLELVATLQPADGATATETLTIGSDAIAVRPAKLG